MSFVRKVMLLFYVVNILLVGSLYALDLIYPEDGTYVVRSNYLILKAGENPPLDGVTVEINGLKSDVIDISSNEYKAVFKDMLILQPELADGINKVIIEGISQEKVIRKTAAEIFFQKNPRVSPPSGFRPYVFHTSQREAVCSSCHNMTPTSAQLKSSSAESNPCGSCHKGMLNKNNVHGPAGVFRCVECHDPESKPYKYKSKGGDAGSCNSCHFDKVREIGQSAFVHGPLKVGLCSICHDAHASDYPAQMIAPVNDVCIGCHQNVKLDKHVVTGIVRPHPLDGVGDPSRPGKQLSCASCHNPHGGANEVFFAKEYSVSRMMLCQKCHMK